MLKAPQTPFDSTSMSHPSRFSFIYFLFTITTNKPICIWKLSENLPFSMWTRTDIGLAFDGAHVYRPESLCIAFWTRSRLVVSLPFSVTKEMPPLGESKFITWKRTKAHTKKWNKINIVILLITWINKKLYVGMFTEKHTHISVVKCKRMWVVVLFYLFFFFHFISNESFYICH